MRSGIIPPEKPPERDDRVEPGVSSDDGRERAFVDEGRADGPSATVGRDLRARRLEKPRTVQKDPNKEMRIPLPSPKRMNETPLVNRNSLDAKRCAAEMEASGIPVLKYGVGFLGKRVALAK